MFKQWIHKKTLKYSLLWCTFTCLIVFSLVACGSTNNSSSSLPTVPPPKASPTAPPSTTASLTPTPFKVTSIDMAVDPKSIAGISCGTTIKVTYTATFHIAPNGPGGTIDFLYTWNDRASPNASVIVPLGHTTATYEFSWEGQVSADQQSPGQGKVITVTPNVFTSPSVKPEGACV